MSIKGSIETLESSLNSIKTSFNAKGITCDSLTLNQVGDKIREIVVRPKETIAHIHNIYWPKHTADYYFFVYGVSSSSDTSHPSSNMLVDTSSNHTVFYNGASGTSKGQPMVSKDYEEFDLVIPKEFCDKFSHIFTVNMYSGKGSEPSYYKNFAIEPGTTFDCDFSGYTRL